MNDLNFNFYSILKNEDAMPYSDEHILVAADGLGGSGSAVHAIDKSKHNMREELLESAFKDATSDDLEWYLNTLIKDMIDDEDDTSALWASRIVIARCVYALTHGEFKGVDLSNEKTRAHLVEFISAGLRDAVNKFKLQNGKYDGQLLLPTTLAFIRYTENDDSVIAETLWAGDSRCYALTPKGLLQLSKDDEDDSGSITNLFYAFNKKTKLNYLCHEIPKPCVLMAVSDGIFDPFDPHDNLGVEHTLLSHIKKCHDREELCSELRGYFDRVHADDATMAFVSFGFDSYADLQQRLADRTEKILAIRQKQIDMHASLEVVNQSPEDAMHYVRSRTSDKFGAISAVLADLLESGSPNFLVTDNIKNILEAVKEARIIAAQKARREKWERSLALLYDNVLKNPESALAEIFLSTDPSLNNSEQRNAYSEFKKAASLYVKTRAEVKELESRKEGYYDRMSRLHDQIQEKITHYRQRFDDLWYSSDKNEVLSKTRKEVLVILHQWEVIDNSVRFITDFERRLQIPQYDFEVVNKARNYITECSRWTDSLEERKRTQEKNQSRYSEAWRKLQDLMIKDENLIPQLLTPEAMKKFELDAKDEPVDDGKITREEIIFELNARKAAIVDEVVEALKEHCNESSVIDAQYNATRLELFRTYFRLKNGSDNSVKEFEQLLKTLEDEYTDLIK